MASPASFDDVWAGFMALDGKEQHKFMHASLKHLLGKPPRAAKKGGAAAGGAAPAERKTNWWTEATKKAMPLLKPVLDETNERLVAEGTKKYRISCVTQFLGGLKEKGELSAELFPSESVLTARFKSFLVEYGKTHGAAAAAAADSGSAASGGSGGSGKSKFSELSPDEQKARRSEAAKKAAATRAAKKAAAAAGEGDE